VSKTLQGGFGFDDRWGLVDSLQIIDDLSAVLLRDLLECNTHQVHNAQLHVRLRVRRPQRFGESD
jgi:hypothetical protein